MKARPKTFVAYTVATFNGDAEVWVHCWPQQKWDYLEDRGKVILSRKNMSMSLPYHITNHDKKAGEDE